MDKPEKSITKDSMSKKNVISTAGLSILNSMEEVASGCSNEDTEYLAGYEIPVHIGKIFSGGVKRFFSVGHSIKSCIKAPDGHFQQND